MKKTILLVTTIFMFSMVGIVSAQTQVENSGKRQIQLTDEQKERFAEEIEAYFDDLNLNESQKQEFKDISIKYAKQLKALKESDKSRFSKYRKYKSIKKKKNKEMKSLLSNEQYEIYKKRQKEMRKKFKARMKDKN